MTYFIILATYIYGEGMVGYPLIEGNYNTYNECRTAIVETADPLKDWVLEDGYQYGLVASFDDENGITTMFCAVRNKKDN